MHVMGIRIEGYADYIARVDRSTTRWRDRLRDRDRDRHRGCVVFRAARTDAESLRRARTSCRRAAHHRQSHTWLAPNRRAVAAAAASAERTAGLLELELSNR